MYTISIPPIDILHNVRIAVRNFVYVATDKRTERVHCLDNSNP